MVFSQKASAPVTPPASPKQRGDAAEKRALAHLQAAGLRLLEANYRVPRRGGGEIDLIVRERDGTLVFVEVRSRSDPRFGGAAASVGASKQRHLVRAAQHYLLRWTQLPPCRFDVVSVEADQVHWIKAAFTPDACY